METKSWFGVRIPVGARTCSSPKLAEPLWNPRCLLFNGYWGSPRLRRPDREADLSPPSCFVVTDEWICTSTFSICLRDMYRDIFTILYVPSYVYQKLPLWFQLSPCSDRLLLQMLANVVLLASTNVAGVFTHYPSELAQREAFLETRQCVEARLTTQRENQQQVKANVKVKHKWIGVGDVNSFGFAAVELQCGTVIILFIFKES